MLKSIIMYLFAHLFGFGDGPAVDQETIVEEYDTVQEGDAPGDLDDGEPEFEDTTAELEKDEETEKEPEPEKEAGKKPTGDKKPEEEGEEKDKPKPFVIQDLFSEDGELDTGKFLSSFEPGKGPEIKEVEFDTQPDKGQTEDDKLTPAQKFTKEVREYKTNFRKNMLAPLQLFAKHFNESKDVNTAYGSAKQAVSEFLEEHLTEYEDAERAKFFEQEHQGMLSKSELREVQAKSQSNQSLVANKLGGAKAYESYVMDPQLGGLDINMIFDITHPDWKPKGGTQQEVAAELQREMNEWWTKLSARDIKIVEYVAELGKLRALKMSFPSVMKKLQGGKTAIKDVDKRGRSKKQPGASNERQDTGQKHSVVDYLNSDEVGSTDFDV